MWDRAGPVQSVRVRERQALPPPTGALPFVRLDLVFERLAEIGAGASHMKSASPESSGSSVDILDCDFFLRRGSLPILGEVV
jgi:hypothetical protein